MLSSVLHSPRAIRVNIEIMRVFVRLRRYLAEHEELAQRLNELEKKYAEHDQMFQLVFEAIRQLTIPPEEESRKQIGFHVKEGGVLYGTRKHTRRKFATEK